MVTKEEIEQLKQNNDIKFIYRIPCSYYNSGFEYIVVGINGFIEHNNVRNFTLDDWFERMKSGSILSYVCCTLSKSNKIKEYLNIYEKPNVLLLRKFISHLTDVNEIIQESMWGVQYITEGKVNRIDVFKNGFVDPIFAINKFYETVNPIYKMSLSKNE